MAVDDYAIYLIDQAKSPTSAFHEFRISMEPGANQIHAFVEGDEDVIFYLPDIRRKAGDRSVYSYRCGGKRAVLETKEFVLGAGYGDERCLFFVDRDYDDFFNSQASADERLLITQVYSIENHLSTPQALEIVLSELVGVKKSDKTFLELSGKFLSSQSAFYRKLLPILAISLAMREAGRKPNYNNLDLKKVFEISGDGHVKRKKNSTAEVLEAFGVQDHKELNLSSVAGWLDKLRDTAPDQAIRGKYDFWFFETCVVSLVKEVIKNKTCPYKIKLRGSLSSGGLLDSIAGRLPIPQYIDAFLDQAMA